MTNTDPRAAELVDIIADAGHGEYLPWIAAPAELTADELAAVWTPPDDLTDEEMSGYYDPDDATWTARTGLAADRRPDALDLSWCYVYRLTTTRARALLACDQLLTDLTEPGPHGDDDTFDYWPSGCRLLFELLETLDDPELLTRAQHDIAEVIAELGYDELYPAVGLPESDEPTP